MTQKNDANESKSLSPSEEEELYRLLELEACAADVKHFFNNWVRTYDPRLPEPYIPMKLFPKQEEFLDWLGEREANKESGLVEKSRDMGVTWLCSGFLVHHWLFRPGFKGGIGSRKEKLVDTIGDPDSIFEKMRIILRNLPSWMLPLGFDWKRHDNFCKLQNPENGATITGEAGDDIGRGGRNSMYFIDEAAFVERPQLIDRSLSANTNVRIDVSTPNGSGNPFATKRNSGKVKVFTLHWKQDCRKNSWELVKLEDNEIIDYGLGGTSTPEDIPDGCIIRYPWYEAEKARLQDPVVIAQELDIDYTASVEGVTIPAKWVQAAVDLHKRINLPRSGDIVAGLDVADGGNASSILSFRDGPVVFLLLERTQGNTTDTANWALSKAMELCASTINYDSVGVGAGVAGTFETRQREQGLEIYIQGINVGCPPSETQWPTGKTSREMFTNLKAELWWTVRRRFEKTYEFVNDGVQYPLDELISIPNIPVLIKQLSSVLNFSNEAGKIFIEKKEALRRRGVDSPDWAEALMLCFASSSSSLSILTGSSKREMTRF